jgi:hypothetical protein
MSFFGTFFGFNGNALNPSTLATPSPQLILEDTSITSDPAISIANIQGAIWLTNNANFNIATQVWDQPNIAAPSFALVINANGSVSRFFAAAIGGTVANPPITWTTVGINLSQMPQVPYSFQRNKIINGSFEIDQRNNGASFTVPNGLNYTVDRWCVFTSQASKLAVQQQTSSPPPGAQTYVRITSLSAYTLLSSDTFVYRQSIEANNVSEIQAGTATALPLTVSFLVRSSLTGTFSAFLRNGTGNRNYAFTFSVPAANTWTFVTATIPGDIAGTWPLTGASAGLIFDVSLGAGSGEQQTPGSWVTSPGFGVSGQTNVVATSGATLDLADVQIETGSTATPFEQRLYGVELALCQRYCYATTSSAATGNTPYGYACINSTTTANSDLRFVVTMRVPPTMTASGTAANYRLVTASATALSVLPTLGTSSTDSAQVNLTVAGGLVAGQIAEFASNGAATQLTFSAEL